MHLVTYHHCIKTDALNAFSTGEEQEPRLLRSTHPVDVNIAFGNDVGVEERGFTSCATRKQRKEY